MSKGDFSIAEFAGRLQLVRTGLVDRDLDAILLFHPVSILWLTGFEGKSYQAFQCLVVSVHGPLIMITREPERYEFEQDALADRLFTWGGCEPQDPIEVFEAVAKQFAIGRLRVGLEVPPYYLHPHHYRALCSLLGAAVKEDPCNLVQELKMIKSPAELHYVRQAAAVADQAMEVFASSLAEGISELELASRVYGHLLAGGSEIPASTMNIASGERAVFSHGAPTRRRLRIGDHGHIEYGATWRRYTATLGRQFSIGHPTVRLDYIYKAVREAGDAIAAEIKDGVAASVPHKTAQEILRRHGLDQYQIHTSGYGLAPGFPPSWGEPISMFGNARTILREGMVLSIEPPVFNGDEGIGVRLIDNVIVGRCGPELLSRVSRELILV